MPPMIAIDNTSFLSTYCGTFFWATTYKTSNITSATNPVLLFVNNKTIKYIAKISNGDIRSAYNLSEFNYYGYNKEVTIDNIKETTTYSSSKEKRFY